MTTALAEAFAQAGCVPPAERLRVAAEAAVKGSPRNYDGAKDALFAAVRHDADLLWEMFKQWRLAAADAALRPAFARLNSQNRAAAVTPVRGAPVRLALGDQEENDRRAALNENAGGQDSNDQRVQPTNAPRVSAAAGADAVIAVAARSLLDIMKVNGKPLGDVTPGEARDWAAKREKTARRDSRFIAILTANLPPDDPIRKFRSPEETQAIFEQAELGNAV